MPKIRFATLWLLAVFSTTHDVSGQNCPTSGVVAQILGSGGPLVSRDRASASYLVWIDGRSRILVDAGGGAFLRFGQAGARIDDLSLIAISHLHPDHVSDLPALLWGDMVRKARLAISGPSGNEAAPDFATFLSRAFDYRTGAFQVLGGTLGGSAGRGVPLDITVVDVSKHGPSSVFGHDDVAVTAIGIPHGNVPTLAYRVRTRDRTLVFSTDQTLTDPRFVDFARGADLLVMHLAIASEATHPFHAAPAAVGRVARDAHVGRVVLSHIGQFDLDAAVRDVKRFYDGPLTVGTDLQCTPVP